MEETLNEDILDFIESVEIAAKKEHKYILENDWRTISDRKKKENEFDLQSTLIVNSVAQAEALFKLAKLDLRHSKVVEALDLLLSSVPTHTDRITKYVNESDYLEKGLESYEVKQEMEFQNDANKHSTSVKSKVRKLQYGESTDSLDIQTFNNTPICLFMSETFEERYPEIKEFLERKKEKYYTEKRKKKKK